MLDKIKPDIVQKINEKMRDDKERLRKKRLRAEDLHNYKQKIGFN